MEIEVQPSKGAEFLATAGAPRAAVHGLRQRHP